MVRSNIIQLELKINFKIKFKSIFITKKRIIGI